MLFLNAMEMITSRQNPLVATCRALARRREAGERRILLDGLHLVEEARAAGLPIQVAAFAAPRLKRDEDGFQRLAAALAASGTRVVRVAGLVMEALSPVRTPTGVVAIAEHAPPSLNAVFEPAPPLVLLLVDVQDPGNVGAVVRTASAAGATGIVTTGATADPFGWKALRGAMGSAFWMPVVRQSDPATVVSALRNRGLRVLAARPRDGRPLYDEDLSAPVAVLLGSEGTGLSLDLARLADESISVPMRSRVESLNVAVTAALVAYEAFRQRTRP